MKNSCLITEMMICRELARLLGQETGGAVFVQVGRSSCSICGDRQKNFTVESDMDGEWKQDLSLSLDDFKRKHLDQIVKTLIAQ